MELSSKARTIKHDISPRTCEYTNQCFAITTRHAQTQTDMPHFACHCIVYFSYRGGSRCSTPTLLQEQTCINRRFPTKVLHSVFFKQGRGPHGSIADLLLRKHTKLAHSRVQKQHMPYVFDQPGSERSYENCTVAAGLLGGPAQRGCW